MGFSFEATGKELLAGAEAELKTVIENLIPSIKDKFTDLVVSFTSDLAGTVTHPPTETSSSSGDGDTTETTSTVAEPVTAAAPTAEATPAVTPVDGSSDATPGVSPTNVLPDGTTSAPDSSVTPVAAVEADVATAATDEGVKLIDDVTALAEKWAPEVKAGVKEVLSKVLEEL